MGGSSVRSARFPWAPRLAAPEQGQQVADKTGITDETPVDEAAHEAETAAGEPAEATDETPTAAAETDAAETDAAETDAAETDGAADETPEPTATVGDTADEAKDAADKDGDTAD